MSSEADCWPRRSPPASLCRGEAFDQALAERLARGRLEGVGERVDRLLPDDDVALRRVAMSGAVACPLVARGARPGCRPAVRVDDADLALVAPVVCVDETLHDSGGVETFPQQREPVGPVARVRVRLSRDCADAGLRPRHHRADREELRLDGDTPLRRLEVARSDRVRRDDHPYVSSVRSSSSSSGRSSGTTTHDTSGRASAALISSGVDARTTTGVPASNAWRRGARSSTESTTSASPSSTSARERELRHLAAGRAEPALSQIVTESPGSRCSTCTPAASFCSSCGVPVRRPNVPQWHGTQRFAPSSSSATAASRGPIV